MGNMFRFKRFCVGHEKGSMKVGVDAVLLGAWASYQGGRILDVGTGCGVIALMLAQRFAEAEVKGIDIDKPSVEEAGENFRNSPWSERLNVELKTFPDDFDSGFEKYGLIVSNPPYFSSGITNPLTSREKARHQDSLSVFKLISHSYDLLTKDGRLSIIFPFEYLEDVIIKSKKEGFNPVRICKVRTREDLPWKRVMMELTKDSSDIDTQIEHLTLFEGEMSTEAYRNLCGEFYLKF